MAFRRSRRGRGRRFSLAAAATLAVVGGVLALGYSSYQTGSYLARSEVIALQTRNDDLLRETRDLAAQRQILVDKLSSLNAALTEAKRQYDNDVPRGPLAEIVALVKDRLQHGVAASRVADVVKDTTMTRGCDVPSARRRFPIKLTKSGAEDEATFFDGLISVASTIPTATADVARDATTTIKLAWLPQPLQRTGLPLTQTITINNVALKLTVEASGVGGYAQAQLTTCGRE